MKKYFLYKKWNLLILLNNMVVVGFKVYKNFVNFLDYDQSKFFFWVYAKRLVVKNQKILNLKKRFDW